MGVAINKDSGIGILTKDFLGRVQVLLLFLAAQFGQRAVINTGTWLKRLDDVKTRFRFLPKIYVPFFCLNYFKISEAEGKIAIDYYKIDKDPPPDLTLLQRLLVYKKRGKAQDAIPERTLI